MTDGSFDFGMIGLGTMGRALLLNMADHGFAVAGLDTDPNKVQALHAEAANEKVQGFTDAATFVASIRKPRAIMMLVPAGRPGRIQRHRHLPADAGARRLPDRRRKQLFQRHGPPRERAARRGVRVHRHGRFHGGEDGARHGPSMMPGGTPENYKRIQPILEAVAAKFEGEPCVALMGAGSAGHYVKTVHNGIEYAIMQLIAESYDLMKRGLDMDDDEIADQFDVFNKGPLGGFLIEIASVVLRKKDPDDPSINLVDVISDKAKQKGTGKWTSQDAMDLGVPLPTIDVAASARGSSPA